MFLECGEAHGELVGHIQREVDRRQDVVVAALGDLGAGIGGLGAVLARQAGQILGHIEIGVDHARAHVAAVRHAAELAAEVGLQIARQFLHRIRAQLSPGDAWVVVLG